MTASMGCMRVCTTPIPISSSSLRPSFVSSDTEVRLNGIWAPIRGRPSQSWRWRCWIACGNWTTQALRLHVVPKALSVRNGPMPKWRHPLREMTKRLPRCAWEWTRRDGLPAGVNWPSQTASKSSMRLAWHCWSSVAGWRRKDIWPTLGRFSQAGLRPKQAHRSAHGT